MAMPQTDKPHTEQPNTPRVLIVAPNGATVPYRGIGQRFATEDGRVYRLHADGQGPRWIEEAG